VRFIPAAFDPRRIAGQIAILVVLSVVVVFAIFAAIIVLRAPPERGERFGWPLQDRFAAVIRVLDAAPDNTARAAVMTSVTAAYPQFNLAFDAAAPNGSATDTRIERLQRLLGEHAITVGVDQGSELGGRSRLVVTLRDGTRVAASLNISSNRPPEISMVLLGGAIFVAVTFALLSLWAARALTSPLTSFSAAAEGFSVEGGSPPLPETGPAEVKALSRALNRMRARISRLVEDRTRMLAAVSHDLRTPITRLRLRAEFVADEAIRGAMLRDLDQMNAMISGALAHLRDGQANAAQAKVDISALLSTIADDFGDLGADITFEGPQRLVVFGRADELARAVTNLVENALKYGGSAALRLRAFPSAIEIDVADRGPGIPAELRDAMTQPFARGDTARNLDAPAGFGLGLSIVRAVAAAHGGTLALLDGESGGLTARLTLPRPPGDATVAGEGGSLPLHNHAVA
jgi:signal transduction histidine kinase